RAGAPPHLPRRADLDGDSWRLAGDCRPLEGSTGRLESRRRANARTGWRKRPAARPQTPPPAPWTALPPSAGTIKTVFHEEHEESKVTKLSFFKRKNVVSFVFFETS